MKRLIDQIRRNARCTHAFKRIGIRSKEMMRKYETFDATFIRIFGRIDVLDFHGVVPPGKLMERIRDFRGSFPSFLVPRVLNIDLAYIFSTQCEGSLAPPPFRSRKSWLMSLKSGLEQWILFPLQFVTFFV